MAAFGRYWKRTKSVPRLSRDRRRADRYLKPSRAADKYGRSTIYSFAWSTVMLSNVTSAGIVCLLSASAVFAQLQTRPQPAFTYFSGPDFCTVQYGYVVPAFCTAPGELPLGSFIAPSAGASYVDPNFGARI